jgi:hypothetical protein
LSGVVTNYILYQNDVQIAEGQTLFTFLLSDLQPYSLYFLKIKVCTSGTLCGWSAEVCTLSFQRVIFLSFVTQNSITHSGICPDGIMIDHSFDD